MAKSLKTAVILTAGVLLASVGNVYAAEESETLDFTPRTYNTIELDSSVLAASQLFKFDSGLEFAYPDAVRGLFVTAHSAGGERLGSLVELVEQTELNAMVIDIKEDFGHLTYIPEEDSALAELGLGQPL